MCQTWSKLIEKEGIQALYTNVGECQTWSKQIENEGIQALYTNVGGVSNLI